MAEQKNIAHIVEEAIRAPIESLGYSIWDTEYFKEGSEWYLRITIDSENGINIDDCEKVYGLIDPIITEMDPIEGPYHLEVSSPGVERELRTAAHYRVCSGQKIRIRFFVPVNGKREIVANLSGISPDGNTVTFLNGEEEFSVEKKKIAKASVFFDFNSIDPKE